MSTFSFLFRELLGAIRARSAVLLLATGLLVLLCLASFVLLLVTETSAGNEAVDDLAADEIVVHLSPRLSAASVNGLFREIRDRDDVARIQFLFAAELTPGDTGGRFLLTAVSAEAATALIPVLESFNGVTDVEAGVQLPVATQFALPSTVKIGLLCALIVCMILSLFLARRGFRVLLARFAPEVRLMRLSGTGERMIQRPVIGLGVLMGFLPAALVIVGMCLFYYAAGGAGTPGPLELASGARLLGAGLIAALLGLLLGGLIGVFASGILGSREFDPLP